jgi:hypothetical protein
MCESTNGMKNNKNNLKYKKREKRQDLSALQQIGQK